MEDILSKFGRNKIQRKADGYVNATALAKINLEATGEKKDPSDWLANKSTKSILDKLSEITGIPVTGLVVAKQGEGTWIHPELETDFVSWLKLTKNTFTEKQVRDKLHRHTGGDIEVITLAGNIDLLTKNELIEVKHVKNWKSAAGQAIIYGLDYPHKQKRIHLFGKATPSFLSMIRQYCTPLNVEVTWEE